MWEASQLHLLRALTRNPHSGPAHFYLALLYKLTNRIEEAKEHFWKVRDGELWALSLFHLGEIALMERNFPQAEELFRRALEKRADDILTRDLLAVALRKQNKNDLAKETLEQSLQLDPLDFFALFELYLIEGEETFRKMLKRDNGLPVLLPNHKIGFTSDAYVFEADDYLSIARIYISAGLWEEAKSALEEYLRESVYPLIYYYLGYIWDKIVDEMKARNYFELASKENPAFVFPNELEDLEVLKTALRYNPKDAHAMLYLGNLLFAFGREREAIENWEKAKDYLKHPVLFRNIAIGHKMVLGDYEKAKEYYEKALELEKNWRLYLEYDRLLSEGKETEKRLSLLLSAPEGVREKFQIAARLAEVYLELGEYDKTIDILMSHTFRPWEGEVRMRQIYYRAYLERGKKLYDKGDYEGALESFQKALEYPRNIGVGKPYNARDEEAKEWLDKTLAKLNEK
ncbi:tetratricopeptide repeat protein [bacterium]|nr:tetratricopeptide repeat protein [bacterium]